MCSWTAVGHTFCLAVCRSGHLSSSCSAVSSSRPQLQVGDDASFVLLYMWALSRLWPVCNFMAITCCHRWRKWKSSLSVRCPRAALKVFFSWKLTLWLQVWQWSPGLDANIRYDPASGSPLPIPPLPPPSPRPHHTPTSTPWNEKGKKANILSNDLAGRCFEGYENCAYGLYIETN